MTISRDKSTTGLPNNEEATLGVPLDGFQDPTGEYPKQEYHYDSSINKAARGTKVNNLYVGGGVPGVSLNIEDQQPSQYPFNQVKETASGHVVEYDDTPGGERILIKHKSGAGIECRADGSLVVSAVNNKIEVTGGDQIIIIEGNGKMHYHGNLDLTVAGDYNVDVAGNYNVNVGGSKNETISQNSNQDIGKNNTQLTKGHRVEKTIESRTMQNFANFDTTSKGAVSIKTASNMELISGGQLLQSATSEWVAVSETANLSATNISVIGVKGTIGGDAVDFSGKVYQGPLGPTPYTSGAAFYGSFFGQATEALHSGTSQTATWSQWSVTAGTAATGPSKPTTPKPPVNKQTSQTPNGPPPNGAIATAHLAIGSYAVRTITVDDGDKMKDSLLLKDDYDGIFEKVPTTQELRSCFRDPGNRSSLASKMVGEGRISSSYSDVQMPKIGRISSNKPSSKFGYNPIGNSVANRGKRFTP
tara:strand:- start:22045 stop:23466 length:1422 start_codon:yes stop_codon:yes gene_type:complete